MVKIICERVRTNDIITSILLWFPRRLKFEMWRRKKRKKREKNDGNVGSEKKDFNIRERSYDGWLPYTETLEDFVILLLLEI